MCLERHADALWDDGTRKEGAERDLFIEIIR